jgi:4-diphosphocytidyl-2-C-methyl-D-erythritol kinase
VTLLAANHLWGNPFSRLQLAEMAIAIGSDVPFFLYGGTALGQGRGEVLTPLHWPLDWRMVLVCPGFRVSTSWAYSKAKIALTKEEKFTKFKSIFNKHIRHAPREVLINDLEGVVFRRHPILRELKDHMYRWDAFYASMSGSGSAIYGLFENHERAEEFRASLITRKDVTVFLCRPIERHPLQGIE